LGGVGTQVFRRFQVARRRAAEKREVLPDAMFKSQLVTKFINKLMYDGKKSLAAGMFYEAIEAIAPKKEGAEGEAATVDRQEGFKMFEQAIENVKPSIEVKSRRIGGANYQVPVEVRSSRRLALAIRWLILHARERREKTFAQKLAGEILEASKNTGMAVKKKEDVHRMAEANRAFAHFRW